MCSSTSHPPAIGTPLLGYINAGCITNCNPHPQLQPTCILLEEDELEEINALKTYMRKRVPLSSYRQTPSERAPDLSLQSLCNMVGGVQPSCGLRTVTISEPIGKDLSRSGAEVELLQQGLLPQNPSCW